MKSYDHKKIEKKWQKTWADKKIYKTLDAKSAKAKGKKPYYVLDMFPYPSGAGLHVGHPRGYIASDVFARMKRMQGYNVLHPMGYDAFGLPAEQYAVQHKVHPEKAVKINIATFRKQLQNIGFSYDWSREVNTTDPGYYRWTQWIFLQIYNSWYDRSKQKARSIDELVKIFEKSGNGNVDAVCDEKTPLFSAKQWKAFSEIEQQNILMKYRLTYEGYAEVNWCAELGTVLANDEVIEKDGKMVSERGEYPVIKKSMRQWFMRITAYADRLLTGLGTIDWSHSIKEIQKNWIGKSEGSEIEFVVNTKKKKYIVFDFDGVVGDTYEASYHATAKAFGLSLKEAKAHCDEYANRKPDHARGATDDVIKENEIWMQKYAAEIVNHNLKMFDGMVDEIKKIPNLTYAFVSSGSIKYIKPMTEKAGLQPTHILAYEDHHSKEEKIENICKDWGIKPSEVIYVTDTKADVLELQDLLGNHNLYGCVWGYCGYEKLQHVLPEDQILHNFSDIHKITTDRSIKVFTTRADTLFGVTYVVLAPEHELVAQLKSHIKNWGEVEKYIKTVKSKSDEDRVAAKEKTGVQLEGIFTINPANGEEVPVWVADYVLANYGTGAVMAVPAHDERDFEFAQKYGLPVKEVITPKNPRYLVIEKSLNNAESNLKKFGTLSIRETDKDWGRFWYVDVDQKNEGALIEFLKDNLLVNEDDSWYADSIGSTNYIIFPNKVFKVSYTNNREIQEYGKSLNIPEEQLDWELKSFIEEGLLSNSDEFNGMPSEKARKAITEFVGGKLVTKYKMRDAIFARQRYWGEPIPLVHSEIKPKLEIEFSGEFRFKLLKQGAKTIEVRALDKKERKQVKVGDVLKFTHIEKKESFLCVVKELWNFRNINDIYKKGANLFKDIFPGEEINTLEDLYERYKKVAKDYEKRIDKFGAVAWRVEKIPESNLITEVLDKNLPLKLPNVKSYAPSGNGESPLATVPAWVKAGYETNTMPGWAGSSWYFLRYTDPNNKQSFASEKELDYWFGKNGGVNMYVGGSEHATGHLLYSRFWHKFLKDLGYVKAEEPFQTLRNQGMIGGADGRKMSKRYGNVINPDDVVAQFGADTLRVYESFMGPFTAHLPWSTDGIVGSRRFIERIWRFAEKVSDKKTAPELEKVLHKTIKKVSEDIADFGFNTAVSAMMIFANELEKHESINTKDWSKFLQILAPFAPHIADELWNSLGNKQSIHIAPWPTYDAKKVVDDTVTIGVQVNGKVRAEITVGNDESEESVKEKVLALQKIQEWVAGKSIRKFIYIPGKIINIVV